MKKINNITVIILILFGVTILFSLLGAIRRRENMDDIPMCYPNTITGVSTPDKKEPDDPDNAKCIKDCEDNQTAGYTSYTKDISNNDKYILKTKIIPPKGTACPINIKDFSKKDKNKDKDDKDEDDKDKKDKDDKDKKDKDKDKKDKDDKDKKDKDDKDTKNNGKNDSKLDSKLNSKLD